LYGRQKGHTLSPYRARLVAEQLPKLRISTPQVDLALSDIGKDLFAAPVKAVWLEIGFGAGEHLVIQARNNPSVGIIGCEPFVNGVARVLAEIDQHNLGNIRLHDDDARLLTAWLPDRQIDRCFILFPDPWPKKRHAKRRLVAPEFVTELARIMKPGAELRFATDIGDYVRTGLHAILASGQFDWLAQNADDWQQRSGDWPPTRYEAKAQREGRQRYYFRFNRV
jgi:tRNA (guanine-N7-)-methyltransferase